MTDLLPERLPFYTIGHSSRSLQEFIDLLSGQRVGCVVDVRKIPMSRTNPQFNSDILSEALLHRQIAYRRLDALGGLRSKAHTIPFELNALWKNRSFHNYADYALSHTFHEGLNELVEEGERRVCAIMCSEAVWWRCHRRLIADNLLAREETVFHIMGSRIDPASLTPGALVHRDYRVTYPKTTYVVEDLDCSSQP